MRNELNSSKSYGDSFVPGWHGGAGLEFFPFKKYGFNIEYVYGAINIDDRYYAKNEAAIWFGFHYYFEKFKK